MTRHLVIEPEALQEIDEAATWYRTRSPRAAQNFLDEVDAAVRSVHLHPERHPVRERGARHFVLPVYPYNIIYVVRDQAVVIIACFHQRRDPVEWYRRV